MDSFSNFSSQPIQPIQPIRSGVVDMGESAHSTAPHMPMQYLNENDAYGVLPTQPLGDYLKAIVETLKNHEMQFAAVDSTMKENDVRSKLAKVEADVAQLQGTHLGPEYVGDARFRAIENDLARPAPTPRQSNPVTVTIAISSDAYSSRGGTEAFRASLSSRLGCDPLDIQVLAPEVATPEGYTKVTFRMNYIKDKAEPAEMAASRLVSLIRGGALDRVMNSSVTEAYRPSLALASLEESPLARCGVERHTTRGMVGALLRSLTTAQKRITESEFWLHHAREYWRKLRAFKKNRWKGNEAACGQLLSSCHNVLRAMYNRKLRRYAEEHKKQRRILLARKRASACLLGSTENGIRRLYYAKWRGWIDTVREARKRLRKGKLAAESMLRGTDRGKRLAAYNTWRAWTTRRLKKKGLVDMLAGISSKALMYKYFQKLRKHQKGGDLRRKKRNATDLLALVNGNGLRAKYYRRLMKYAEQSKKHKARHRLQEKLAYELQGRSAKSQARHGYDALKNYARMRAKQRETDTINRLSEYVTKMGSPEDLNCKVDDLGDQVDVSLKTLTNTNSVLNKLVDRLISVDEQLDHLDKTKEDKGASPVVIAAPEPAAAAVAAPTQQTTIDRRDISPPRMNRQPEVVSRPAPVTDSKEAEQYRLLQVERARLQEVENNRAQLQMQLSQQPSGSVSRGWGGGGHGVGGASVGPHSPTPEDTLARARQWQRESVNLYNTPLTGASAGIAPPRGNADASWRLT